MDDGEVVDVGEEFEGVDVNAGGAEVDSFSLEMNWDGVVGE